MRSLTNCLLSGQFAALLITQLVLLLNPNIALTIRNVAGIWMVLAPTYGLAIGAALWLVLLLTEAIRGRSLGPAWFSFPVSTWLLMLVLAGGAALAWHNVVSVRLYVPAEHRTGLAMSATVLTTAAAILFVLGLFHYSFGRRGVRASFVLFGVALTTSLVAPFLLLREPPEPETWPRMPLADNAAPRRLTIIGIEGASMSYVLPAVAEGHLPNFARLLETGASGALRTLYPTESVPVWTSIATGKLPRQHGLKGFYRYRFPFVSTPVSMRPRGLYFQGLDKLGLVQRSAVTSSLRETQPFWVILSRFGVTQGLVRWWGSYPAKSIDGFMVTEYLHRQAREGLRPPLPELTHPPELCPCGSSA